MEKMQQKDICFYVFGYEWGKTLMFGSLPIRNKEGWITDFEISERNPFKAYAFDSLSDERFDFEKSIFAKGNQIRIYKIKYSFDFSPLW